MRPGFVKGGRSVRRRSRRRPSKRSGIFTRLASSPLFARRYRRVALAVAAGIAILAAWQALAAWRWRPPSEPGNLCSIFREQPYWYAAASRAEYRFGVDVSTTMAVLFVESGFRRNARPPRSKLWGWLPWSRVSSAYGYAQATEPTWRDFESARGSASRNDPRHAVEFVAWYFERLRQTLRARMPHEPTARELYAAYHQGAAGFLRGDWRDDVGAVQAISRFEAVHGRYREQFDGCAGRVHRTWLLRAALRWTLGSLAAAAALWWLARGGARTLIDRLGRMVRSARR